MPKEPNVNDKSVLLMIKSIVEEKALFPKESKQ